MFFGCASLASVDALSVWDTSRVESLSAMFDGCSSLTSVDALSGWDTSRVEGMNDMFNFCTSLASADISGWNTSALLADEQRGWSSIFAGCFSLKSYTVGEGFEIKGDDMVPDPTSETGKWWSTADNAWYTKDEIVANRSGIADTYLANP